MVLNDFFGSRESLPFDLKHKAGPITYSLAPGSTKDQIMNAAAKLAGELKYALRLVLQAFPDGEQNSAFKENEAARENPARYFSLNESSAIFGDDGYALKDGPLLYLRIIPGRPTEPIRRSQAYDLLHGGMTALYPRSLTAYRATNKYGAISFDTDGGNEVIRGTQLFTNRELWAFDTVLLRAKDKGPKLGIPTLAFEQGIARAVYEDVDFAAKKLGIPLPIDVEVGAFPVEKYILNMPNESDADLRIGRKEAYDECRQQRRAAADAVANMAEENGAQWTH